MKKQNFRRKNKPSTKPEGLYVESWSALQEYLQYQEQRIKKIECPDRDMNRLGKLLEGRSLPCPIEQGAESLKVFVQEDFRDEFRLEEKLPDQLSPVVLALDHITDTRNLGAILRSASFFGVSDIVVPQKRQAPIALGTMSTCQGALVFTDVYSVVNLVRTLRKLKDHGYWIVGTDMGGEPMDRYSSKYEKVVLVMGSEDKGLSRLVRKACDVIVSIEGAPNRVESLNVAVAAGIVLQQFSKSL
ncbi:23S rRNA (guanosine(2251)-2'-O)-methyltransferase RlmB [Pseudobacteriovorax antillogorgiicola]|uniref:rRNA methylase, putative, group 3 n=1 Tax=Pseudobacteriovorax antillogorgiicola TaxID=1513793 RepID=A0A1Y6B2D8_9BACT|nr:23S rRNA (guanosine(2251)-2'-O)-methyltransferase RlmB [Pseudobacteriovorax antillogorgiicola]TCS59483.1 putative rRNA methylase [Pseudobacteriovorax antillogorgiicola]SME87994.1 rRNA methylase, putative, group 3 [Pseudobacteriovorax antillogorgiicola]